MSDGFETSISKTMGLRHYLSLCDLLRSSLFGLYSLQILTEPTFVNKVHSSFNGVDVLEQGIERHIHSYMVHMFSPAQINFSEDIIMFLKRSMANTSKNSSCSFYLTQVIYRRVVILHAMTTATTSSARIITQACSRYESRPVQTLLLQLQPTHMHATGTHCHGQY